MEPRRTPVLPKYPRHIVVAVSYRRIDQVQEGYNNQPKNVVERCLSYQDSQIEKFEEHVKYKSKVEEKKKKSDKMKTSIFLALFACCFTLSAAMPAPKESTYT